MPLSMEEASAQTTLLDDPAPPPKRGHSPTQFSVHVYCGQTAVCIRIPLGTEVGFSLGGIVLDGDPAPILGQCPLWPNGWMD